MSSSISAGPTPTLITRSEVSTLYSITEAATAALAALGVPYILTGGSLLGAVRQKGLLFCDDDVDLAILDLGGGEYERAKEGLGDALGPKFQYSVRPWEGGDRIRMNHSAVFLDVFTIRRYESLDEMTAVLGRKRNGQEQPYGYVRGILNKIFAAAGAGGDGCFPCYHFSERKAVEMWSKEIYKPNELFPLRSDLDFGPLRGCVSGPRCPVTLLKRAFGEDCFEVYFQSGSHKDVASGSKDKDDDSVGDGLKPLLQAGGMWEGGVKTPLLPEHYVPIQPLERAKRKPTAHCKASLFEYLGRQEAWEKRELRSGRVYMDGVFDLFHAGHLESIRSAMALGSSLVVGVTGDDDAEGYKRRPVISESDRADIVSALEGVEKVIMPCPLVVTEEFMEAEGIDLVVHGFADDADFEKQREFFAAPIRLGKFEKIPYSKKDSTTQILRRLENLTVETGHTGGALDTTETRVEQLGDDGRV